MTLHLFPLRQGCHRVPEEAMGRSQSCCFLSAGRQRSSARATGLVLFEIDGWQDAIGHATLWNGRGCYDHCYFNEAGANYTSRAANFWRLT
jgi:hypothetical protein